MIPQCSKYFLRRSLNPKNYPKIQSQKVAVGAVSGFFLLSIIHGLSHQPYLFVDSNLLDQGAKELVAKPAATVPTVPTVPTPPPAPVRKQAPQVPQVTWMTG